MHPYQDQITNLWEIIKLQNRAAKSEFWIEAIALTYIIFEVQLRLLLTSKAGESSIPVPSGDIDDKRHLRDLTDLAIKKKFIDNTLYDKILSFNNSRNKMIHGLIQGKIQYSELKNTFKSTSSAIYEIQSRWLKITVGPLQTRPDLDNIGQKNT
jgi:hypothetical protein